jgi:hypothetical protein
MGERDASICLAFQEERTGTVVGLPIRDDPAV